MGKKQLFSKAAIDQVQSPEELNDYIKVTTPAVWIILVAIIALLVSLAVWLVFGTVDLRMAGGDVEAVPLIRFILG